MLQIKEKCKIRVLKCRHMRSNVLLLPKLFLSPALSRHCRRSSQHSPEYRVQILHGGPQHPHPHSQQQQLQRDVSLHARSQGGADTSQQTGSLTGQKNPELLRAVDQWTGGEGPVGGGGGPAHFTGSRIWRRTPRCTKILLNSSTCHSSSLTQLKHKPCYELHAVVKVNPECNKERAPDSTVTYRQVEPNMCF